MISGDIVYTVSLLWWTGWSSVFLFSKLNKMFYPKKRLDTLIQGLLLKIIKINSFWGNLTDILAKKEALVIVHANYPRAAEQPRRFCSSHRWEQHRDVGIHGWWKGSWRGVELNPGRVRLVSGGWALGLHARVNLVCWRLVRQPAVFPQHPRHVRFRSIERHHTTRESQRLFQGWNPSLAQRCKPGVTTVLAAGFL